MTRLVNWSFWMSLVVILEEPQMFMMNRHRIFYLICIIWLLNRQDPACLCLFVHTELSGLKFLSWENSLFCFFHYFPLIFVKWGLTPIPFNLVINKCIKSLISVFGFCVMSFVFVSYQTVGKHVFTWKVHHQGTSVPLDVATQFLSAIDLTWVLMISS